MAGFLILTLSGIVAQPLIRAAALHHKQGNYETASLLSLVLAIWLSLTLITLLSAR